MIITAQEFEKFEETASKYLKKVGDDSFVYENVPISKNDAEILLNYDDSSYTTREKHPIENYDELRRKAPNWESTEEYLDRKLKRQLNGYSK